ncbi:hypothetical protein COV42_01835 [Candidatus Campbellbacteria bacterium CG11_big_fil_rev_8_21_14_0_20_44_21]|uniref:Uncharacterized protein n=1 Tax=Candidatus Campbellbacteria bacterium CG22_combo_CG10-13_8_21_14_all_43_18 TaxID=1974530 RepID=A0A2H0DXZ0_9BACT|nr:MAG: hypothetical protein COW82_01280 [Candidatus Campbellbacteria bacterium CG22_combo_CG10-13_8_21_14_all_43_18]PIR24246.1 MAG: hypothetical protein COV42_01835 [Candidatus Campbellbacteria bacterium CG11_big_fil_rev_8_21_14_0_20_44_21]
MKWIAISGSWRKTSKEVENDVRQTVRDIISRGDGIVTGGALNVDSFATDEALKVDPTAKQIKVFLPVTLERYAAHYRKRADEGVITHDQAEELIALLTKLKETNPEVLIEDKENTVVDKATYFERNSKVMEIADELAAFQINNSEGVQDTADKAYTEGKPVHLKRYQID